MCMQSLSSEQETVRAGSTLGVGWRGCCSDLIHRLSDSADSDTGELPWGSQCQVLVLPRSDLSPEGRSCVGCVQIWSSCLQTEVKACSCLTYFILVWNVDSIMEIINFRNLNLYVYSFEKNKTYLRKSQVWHGGSFP